MEEKAIIKEVTGDSSPHFITEDGKEVVFWSGGFYKRDRETNRLSMNDIGNLCKVWAGDNGYSVSSGNRVDGSGNFDIFAIHKDEDFEASGCVYYNDIFRDEANGIIKATEWVYDKIKGRV